ncbi:hypothetical protein ACEV7T_06605 [Vibrio parahaemolyticus]
MNLEDIFKISAAIVTSLGGASIIVIAASSWLAKVWANRILEKEKGEIQKEIEQVRSNNKVYLDTLSNSSLLFLESQKAITVERTAAIKSLWFTFLELKDSKPTLILFLDTLPFQEYKQIHINPQMSQFDDALSIEGLNESMKADVQSVRPFVDEKAFMYFWVYRALIGRLAFYLREIRENGAPEKPWQKTNKVTAVLSPVLCPETIKSVQEQMWPTQRLFEHIELLLVEHLRELASGKDVSSNSLEHLVELSKATSVLRRNDDADSQAKNLL